MKPISTFFTALLFTPLTRDGLKSQLFVNGSLIAFRSIANPMLGHST